MKKAEDMVWIVHPYSYKKKGTEISVVHESDFHAISSYGWFSKTKIFIYDDSYGHAAPMEARKLMVRYAEDLCKKMNKENPIPIATIQKRIDKENARRAHWDKLLSVLDD